MKKVTVDEIIESIRYFAEKSNSVSSLQIHVDIDGGFGGLGLSVISELRDDFGPNTSIPVIGYGKQGFPKSEKEALSTLELSVLLSQLCDFSSFFVPLSSTEAWKAAFWSNSDLQHLPIHSSSIFGVSFAGLILASATSRSSWILPSSKSMQYPIGSLECLIPNSQYSIDDIVSTFDKQVSEKCNGRNPFLHSMSLFRNDSRALTLDSSEHKSSPIQVFSNVLSICETNSSCKLSVSFYISCSCCKYCSIILDSLRYFLTVFSQVISFALQDELQIRSLFDGFKLFISALIHSVSIYIICYIIISWKIFFCLLLHYCIMMIRFPPQEYLDLEFCNDMSSITSLSSVGCDSTIGDGLNRLASDFGGLLGLSTNSTFVGGKKWQAHLDRYQVERDDCKNIQERLIDLASM